MDLGFVVIQAGLQLVRRVKDEGQSADAYDHGSRGVKACRDGERLGIPSVSLNLGRFWLSGDGPLSKVPADVDHRCDDRTKQGLVPSKLI